MTTPKIPGLHPELYAEWVKVYKRLKRGRVDAELLFARYTPVQEHLKDLRPEPYPNDASLYSACWSVLVLFGGAHDDAFLETKYPTTEFRFCGLFGFGGKFWRYDGKLYVAYYPEDRTNCLDEVRDTINSVLERMTPEGGVWGPPA